jgi:uncharacterized protein (DUF1015 family)
MPRVYPFNALQFQAGRGDVSTLVAPPYDVLDAAGKAALLERNRNNIVSIDLPHTPAKALGPASVYEQAAVTLQNHISSGTISARTVPAMFAYRQTTTFGTSVSQRCGMAVCVDAVPFGPRPGGGILPHEETFSGPKEDRMALMKATRTQLSPVFGLHADESGKATAIIRALMAARQPDMTARTDEGVFHEVWTLDDAPTLQAYQDALAGEDIFIADGHHRYTTGLNYLAGLEAQATLPNDHPARRSMMVLVGMSDPGLVIWPTHRVLGGMDSYSFDALAKAAQSVIRIDRIVGDLQTLEKELERRDEMGPMRFGLYDFATKAAAVASPVSSDPLKQAFPDKPNAWRQLVVAFIQYMLVEQIAQKSLNASKPISWAFPHTIGEVEQIGSGVETGAGGGKGFAQLAVIVRPTPLSAVRDVSRANQLMPQKSTFFYPKLATGLFMHSLHA